MLTQTFIFFPKVNQRINEDSGETPVIAVDELLPQFQEQPQN